MSECCICVNLDKGELLEPMDYNSEALIHDHAWTDDGIMHAVERALSPEGPWYKHRLIWAGMKVDAKESSLEQTAENVKKEIRLQELFRKGTEEENLYRVAWKYFLINDGFEETQEATLRYLVNHTKKEYVDMHALPESADYLECSVHPLPFLLCSKTRAYGYDAYAGRWRADSISTERTLPEGYLEIQPDFVG